MECHTAGWVSKNQWEATLRESCDSKEAARALEKKARRAASNMSGNPRSKVSVTGSVVYIDLKYSRGTVTRVFGADETQVIAGRVESEFRRKLR